MSKTIVKVQLPIFSVGAQADMPLVYDEHRQHQVVQQIPPGVFKAIKKSDNPHKGFFKAAWDEITGTWLIADKPVAWQEW